MKWKITFGLSGGMCGTMDEDVIEAATIDQANLRAWERACNVYDEYAGMHGLRDVEQIMDEEGLSEDEARYSYEDERESWLDYSAAPPT